MSGPVVLAFPAVLFAIAAAVAVVAFVLAVALLGVGLSLPRTGPRWTQLLVVPLAAAALHAGVLLAGELSWPRPSQRVRSARLVVRSVRQDAPRGTVALFLVAWALTWAACAVGAVMADGTGRALSVAHDGMTSTAGPFPGAHYAGPIALAAAGVVVLTWAVLLRVPCRPAVPEAEAASDGTLRRAAAHRALRVSTAALLATTAALLVLGGTAAHGIGGAWSAQVGEVVRHDAGPGPVWNAVAAAVVVGGGLLALSALAVLLVPARGVRR